MKLLLDENIGVRFKFLSALALPVIVIDVHKNVLPSLKIVYPSLISLLAQSLENQVYIVK